MFRKSTNKTQLGIFSSPNLYLSGRSESFYEKKDAWHNLFRVHVISRIDESIFKPLFTEQTGSPNASVRVLIGMMILKEGNGWSDQQLFEHCRFNLLVRRALGLVNMDDAIPTESTYYLFRKRIVEYEKANTINLFEKTFSSVTAGQVSDFNVSGKSIRMDSKLLGSNIAWLSRYELIHETLRLFCQDVKDTLITHSLSPSETMLVENLLKEKGNKVVYRSTHDEVKTKIQELGWLTYKLIQFFNSSSSKHYLTLNRVFSDQFIVDENKIVIARSKEEISSQSVQSPHDTDCHYRNKDGNQVKGYSINVTESCDKQELNLITHVDVNVVTTPDNDFLQNSINETKEIIVNAIENLHADGAYHSSGNQEFCRKENIDLIINAIQGPKGRYDLFLDKDNQLTVVDTITNETVIAKKQNNEDKWRIKTAEHYRYFTTKEITACSLRRKIDAIPQEILNIRNNVEATIFQLGFHYNNSKSRYRGLIKHKMWANIRCLWVNFVRIVMLNPITMKINRFFQINNPKTKFIFAIEVAIINFKVFLLEPKNNYRKTQFV
ncbi:MAG: transposase [Bacteroidetes bacterium]|nr:transposase [Bacteroidota bacterium]